MFMTAPSFVNSFPHSEHVYFFFRETAVEYINCGKSVYSRVARVCSKDKGGPHKFRYYFHSNSFYQIMQILFLSYTIDRFFSKLNQINVFITEIIGQHLQRRDLTVRFRENFPSISMRFVSIALVWL
jgi:hypothetical protein